MPFRHRKIRVGIVGCGAIGSRIAASIHNELKTSYQLTGLYDINLKKSQTLEKKLALKNCAKSSLDELIQGCDLVVEAVNARDTRGIISAALRSKKHILAMSVGKLLKASALFRLATHNRCALLLPSGAIAGVDALKAASLGKITHITLTTRKPPSGLSNNPYLTSRGIDLSKISKETVLFEGSVDDAVKFFPQNINVAATIALASQSKPRITIRIITSPDFQTNSHQVELKGDFGSITTRTDNVVCPDNPKTSYLAVLSGIQTLKQFSEGLKIGT